MQYDILVSSMRNSNKTTAAGKYLSALITLTCICSHIRILFVRTFPQKHITIRPIRCCDRLVAELGFCLPPGGGTQTNLFVYQIYAGLKLILPIALPIQCRPHHIAATKYLSFSPLTLCVCGCAVRVDGVLSVTQTA